MKHEKAIASAEELLVSIAGKLATYDPSDLVDIGAKLKSMAQLCDNIVSGWERKSKGETIIAQEGVKQLIRPRARPDNTKPGQFAIIGTGYKALFMPYQQHYIDTSALKEALPDVAAKFTKTTACERMSFTGI